MFLYGLCICILLKYHTELSFSKRIFRKNSYPENFIDKCFKKFLDNIHHNKEQAFEILQTRNYF